MCSCFFKLLGGEVCERFVRALFHASCACVVHQCVVHTSSLLPSTRRRLHPSESKGAGAEARRDREESNSKRGLRSLLQDYGQGFVCVSAVCGFGYLVRGGL